MAEFWGFIVHQTQFVAVWWFTSVGSYGLIILAVLRFLLAVAMLQQARRTQEGFDRWLLYMLAAVNFVAMLNFKNSTPLTPFNLLITLGLISYFVIRWRRKLRQPWKPGDPTPREMAQTIVTQSARIDELEDALAMYKKRVGDV